LAGLRRFKNLWERPHLHALVELAVSNPLSEKRSELWFAVDDTSNAWILFEFEEVAVLGSMFRVCAVWYDGEELIFHQVGSRNLLLYLGDRHPVSLRDLLDQQLFVHN